jgi:Domain of unknown function (DUF6457)
MPTTAADWIRAFCEEIRMPAPDEQEAEAILRLAAVAAHASERIAAPMACWVAGASGKPLAELIEVAEGLEAKSA